MEIERTAELSGASSDVLAKEIVKVLLEKKGIDVKMYDVRETTSITDYYVNVTGRSSTHVSALADELTYLLEMRGKNAERVEGKRGNSWILVDYLDVIVNVFDSESRSFYNFERLLPEESLCDISELVAEVDKKFETN